MTERSVDHDTFTIERDYAQPIHGVFAAWADPEPKRRWFGSSDGVTIDRFKMDFRAGGDEVIAGMTPGGAAYEFQCRYHEIVENTRIIYSYLMQVEEQILSVSNATVQFEPERSGTLLTYTEQAAFLDGLDDASSRVRGTEHLLDALGEELAHQP